jgi:hypothetical protein
MKRLPPQVMVIHNNYNTDSYVQPISFMCAEPKFKYKNNRCNPFASVVKNGNGVFEKIKYYQSQ